MEKRGHLSRQTLSKKKKLNPNCQFGSNPPLEKGRIDICQSANSWFLYAGLYEFSVGEALDGA